MRDETRAKLERKLLLDRVRLIAMVSAGVLAFVGLLVFLQSRQSTPGSDPLLEERTVSGTVKHWYQVPMRQAQGQDLISVTVQLDSGKDVQAGSSEHHTAKAGEHIALTEKHYKSGRVTYVWK